MIRIAFTLAILANSASADVENTLFRISCGTFADIMQGNVETTKSVKDYFAGIIDTTAALNGIISPDKTETARRKIVSTCDRNRDKSLRSVLANSISKETF